MSESEETEGKATVLATSGFLVLIGIGTLLALMYFSWSLGVSLGKTWWDQRALGILHVAAELASAGLVGWAAVIAARGRYFRSWCAFICAIVFASVSVLNTYGFMSPRMSAVEGHMAVLEIQKGHAGWLKQQTVNPEVADAFAAAAAECATGRGPRCLAAEARAKFLSSQQGNMGAKLEEQFKQLEKTASSSPDPHAVALASVTGLSVPDASKLITLLMASFGQCVKFACMFFGFKGFAEFHGRRVAHRNEPAESQASSSGSASGSGGSEPFKPKLVHSEPTEQEPARANEAGSAHREPTPSSKPEPLKVSSAMASVPEPGAPKLSRDELWDLLRRQVDGLAPKRSSRENAQQTGWPQRTIARYEKRLRDQAKSRMKRYAGNGLAPHRRNGGGLHVVL